MAGLELHNLVYSCSVATEMALDAHVNIAREVARWLVGSVANLTTTVKFGDSINKAVPTTMDQKGGV